MNVKINQGKKNNAVIGDVGVRNEFERIMSKDKECIEKLKKIYPDVSEIIDKWCAYYECDAPQTNEEIKTMNEFYAILKELGIR